MKEHMAEVTLDVISKVGYELHQIIVIYSCNDPLDSSSFGSIQHINGWNLASLCAAMD